jgi:hypothetical protein
MRTKRGPLSPERIAALTATGHLDLANHNWYLTVPRDEWTRVYTLRAAAERRAATAERRRAREQSTA